MTALATDADVAVIKPGISTGMTFLLAASCGLIVANLYYAQPLVREIGTTLGLASGAAGLIVTVSQVGYGLGLLLIVPLGDLMENRRLIVTMIGLSALALLGAALANSPMLFLAAAFGIGLGSVAAQVLVPFAAHMAPEASRGKVVGNVMSGLMLGIMLARPVSSFIASVAPWHAVFFGSSASMLVLAFALSQSLPQRVPAGQIQYGALLRSMGRLALTTKVLQRRALYHACLFGAFSLFWTTVPLLLAGPQFHLSQAGIALFALAGVAGAIASPIAGRVADKGLIWPATLLAMLCVAGAFLLSRLATDGSNVSLGLLVAVGILVDFGVAANLTLGQRAIFALGAEYRSRLNGLYMATFFAGGAIGSALGGWAYATGGWHLTAWIGMTLPLLALGYFATERRG